MRRRELLTGALAAAAGGCAAHRLQTEEPFPIDAFDRRLASITDPFRDFVKRESARPDAVIPDLEHELLVGSLRTLFVAGALHDRPHPKLRSRMATMLPEGARSLQGVTRYLEGLPPAERIQLQRGLQQDRELPLRTAEHLDRLAASVELGPTSRFKLRSLATETAWRLSHQPVSLLLDETTARIHKAERRAGDLSASERASLLAALQQDEEWDEASEYEEEEPYQEEQRPRERRPWGGRATAIVGGALGIVGLVGGYGSLLWAYGNSIGGSSQTGPITLAIVSGVTFVVGVVVMISGLVTKSRQDREWLERNPRPRRRR